MMSNVIRPLVILVIFLALGCGGSGGGSPSGTPTPSAGFVDLPIPKPDNTPSRPPVADVYLLTGQTSTDTCPEGIEPIPLETHDVTLEVTQDGEFLTVIFTGMWFQSLEHLTIFPTLSEVLPDEFIGDNMQWFLLSEQGDLSITSFGRFSEDEFIDLGGWITVDGVPDAEGCTMFMTFAAL